MADHALRRYGAILGLLVRNRRRTVLDPARATEENAQALARDLEALGPTFVKLGQLLSTRPDLLPPPTIRALSKLQDSVGPFDTATLKSIITEELAAPIDERFAEFDDEPLAAASLGQVHRAKLLDGTHVVVKVQRPNIR